MARFFLLAGMVALPLQAAGTVEVVYTLTPSYLLFAVAFALGLPEVIRGASLLPTQVKLAAGALVAVYLLMIVFGDYVVVSEQARGGALRAAVYTGYVIFGLVLLALVTGMGDERALWWILGALVLGGALAAAYGIYSWFALHYDLPASDINNAVNSDGFTYGHRPQGAGLFGWERIRGTFTEPIGFGGFLTSMLPLTVPLIARSRTVRDRTPPLVALCLMLLALALTDSSISAASVMLGGGAAVLVAAIALRLDKLVALAFAATALVAFLIVTLLFNPEPLSAVTGRTTASLGITLSDRTTAWRDAERVWASRPVTGYGPGQAAARLARRQDPTRVANAPVTLRSAQGIVMSSLVDAGILGFAAWVCLFAGTISAGVGAALRRRDLVLPSAIGATVAGIFVAAVNGDRVDLRVWVVMSVLLAATAGARGESDRRGSDREAGKGA